MCQVIDNLGRCDGFRFADYFMVKRQIAERMVVVNNINGVFFYVGQDFGRQCFFKQRFACRIDDNDKFAAEIILVGDAVPSERVAQIFRDINRAV